MGAGNAEFNIVLRLCGKDCRLLVESSMGQSRFLGTYPPSVAPLHRFWVWVRVFLREGWVGTRQETMNDSKYSNRSHCSLLPLATYCRIHTWTRTLASRSRGSWGRCTCLVSCSRGSAADTRPDRRPTRLYNKSEAVSFVRSGGGYDICWAGLFSQFRTFRGRIWHMLGRVVQNLVTAWIWKQTRI